jgi:hypothetical protein
MPAAYFVVRATVSDPARRAAFDRWYWCWPRNLLRREEATDRETKVTFH